MSSFSQPKASVLEARRWAPRHACKLYTRITVGSHECHCVIENISQGGAGISCDSLLRPSVHERVILRTDEIGTVTGNVRWVFGRTAGIEFTATSRASPHLRSYLDRLSGDAGF